MMTKDRVKPESTIRLPPKTLQPAPTTLFCAMVSLAVLDGPYERLQHFEEEAKYLSALNDAILRASCQSLIVVDEAGFICLLSEDIPNIFGYEQAESLINRNVGIIIQDLSSSLNLGDYSQREARGVHTDGGFLQLEVGIAAIRSATERGSVAITIKRIARLKKRRISQGLRESAAYILDAAFDPMFCTDGEGVIIMVNQAAVKEFGWSETEFIGQNVRMIVGAEHQDRHDSYMQHYIETGVKKMIGKKREIQARRKDGTEFVAELGLAEIPQKDFDEHIFCGFIRNLTKEKDAQAEIIAKQNLTSKIIDASFDALFVINQHGIIQMVNDQSTKSLGWSRDEFIGQNINMIMPENHSANHDSYLARYLETGIKNMMGTEREVEARRKDGSKFPCILGLAEVDEIGGSDRLFCGFIRSLAREKALERRVSDEEERNLKNAKEILEQKSTILGILDASFDALFVITEEERIIQMVNQKSCDMFGWTREEFIGQNISMIMTNDVAAHHDQYVENYLATGVKKMIGKQREVVAKRKDGSTFPAALGLAEPQAAGLICGFIRDLTQEKASQAEIIAKQNLTSKIIDASFDALFVINQHGIIQMVNDQSTKSLGWSRDEFIGQNINMIMPENHSANHDSYLARYLETGIKNMMGTEREVEARRKDGSKFPCILGLAEIDEIGGSDRLFCGFIRSLAREKALERRVSDEEERNLKNAKEILEQKSTILGILDASFDALFVITEEDRIIQMVNQKSCDVFGWTREEFIGQNISMIMTNDVAAHHDQYVENYLATGVKKMIGKQREIVAKRKDGSTFPAALGLAEPQAAGLICGFIRDLTQEKAAEEEIIREQLLTSKIIDASFDALFVINDGGIIQQVNKASCSVFGWSREEFVGQNIKMIMPDGHAENHDRYLSRYLQSGFKKMIGKEREIEARRRDGSTFPCILGLSEVVTNGTTQFVGFVRDVTIQKSLLLAEAEREASDSLLFNILPEHIAYRLKADPSHIADHYDNTTILFADIVGFTDKTSKMSPHDVVSMLNDIFSRFDHLCDVYELSGQSKDNRSHIPDVIPPMVLCEHLVMPVVPGVGISTGSVVAGVVGIKRFLFDMWGDAVNVAARMEQSGLAGQIQVTRNVVDSAGSDFTFELRGTLAIKGKGPMDVFMLKSAKPSEKWRHSLKWSEGPRPQGTLRSKSMFI
ncbi:hypothetical protein HJC23_012052 [Cyclotella cryptica]|uniref:Uncharacterized protein n=1 Tax=Cyclotella cryptica TaxID=29204 RepID=A0ABD3PRZ8_9STRA